MDDSSNNNASSSHDFGSSAMGSSDEHEIEKSTGSQQNEVKQLHLFSKKETRYVKIFRLVVAILILGTGALVSSLTYKILQSQVDSDSRDAFVLFANAIEGVYKYQVYTIFEANRALSRGISTAASEAQAEFPYFSVPAFEAKAHEARVQAGFEIVMYAPVAQKIDTWLQFAQESRGWLDESKAIYDALEPGLNRSREALTPPLPEAVYDYDEDGQLDTRTSRGFFMPSLHVSPPPVFPAGEYPYQNINLYSNPVYKDISLASVELKDSVFSAFDDDLVDFVDNIVGPDRHEASHRDSEFVVAEGSAEERKLHPHSIISQPVYKALLFQDNSVVGYLYSIITWNHYLENLLPEGVQGILAVIRNSCGQAVTYELNGRHAEILGKGELFDPAFESQKVTVDFSNNYFDPEITSKVSGHCQIFLDIYPSETFNEAYESDLPVIFSISVAVLFLVMALFFFMYDRLVQYRNGRLVGHAARSNALVSQLYPTQVRDRLMNDMEEEQKQKEANNNKLKNFKNFVSAENEPDETRGGIDSSPPIADLFPDCTIFFGDLAGFTSWSSTREPTQVFTLLETVYFAFDEVARRRRVYKVETVGDCYVAACGLPEKRSDHYIGMTRFALECMTEMQKVTKRLSATLGPDTANLKLRAGMHSGAVTAGVLRGKRSRFQLFGDTMNVAARMEQNGLPGYIQLSQETADLIAASGRSHWFYPREDKITAKGKGELQTYFLELSRTALSSTVGSSSRRDGSTDSATEDDVSA